MMIIARIAIIAGLCVVTYACVVLLWEFAKTIKDVCGKKT